jgi:arsenate reductase
MSTSKQRVLFICTHNSARSQMAEGFLNALYGDRYEGHSAGIEPLRVNPYAIKVMAEYGFDISKHRSKSVEEFRAMRFDYVVTVCNQAREVCPFFPGGKALHKSFEDPSTFKGSTYKVLKETRRIRNEVKDWIERTFGKEHFASN